MTRYSTTQHKRITHLTGIEPATKLQSGMLSSQPHDGNEINWNIMLNWNKNLQVGLLLLHIISLNQQNTLIYLMQGTKFLSGKILENIDAGHHISLHFFLKSCNYDFLVSVFGFRYFAVKFPIISFVVIIRNVIVSWICSW